MANSDHADHVVVDFLQTQRRSPFHHTTRLLSSWLRWSLWTSTRCFAWNICLCWNWCLFSLSGQVSFISMVYSCLCCCHRSKKIISLNFATKVNLLCLKPILNWLVNLAKGFLKLVNMPTLFKKRSLSLSRDLALATFVNC